jgi:hypothetical protein
MKITKKQLRRIIKEELAITGAPAAGPNLGRQWIDVVMDELASGDIDMAADAIMSSFMMDDTWAKEEEALEAMLAKLGRNPSVEDVNAVASSWLKGYRAGNFAPTPDEHESDWAKQSQRLNVRKQKRSARWSKGVSEQRIIERRTGDPAMRAEESALIQAVEKYYDKYMLVMGMDPNDFGDARRTRRSIDDLIGAVLDVL